MLRFSSLALLALALSAHAAQTEFKNVEEAKAAAFKSEEQGLWKQIDWRRDPVAAQAEAKRTGKPLMVFMLVGEWGREKKRRSADQAAELRGAVRSRIPK